MNENIYECIQTLEYVIKQQKLTKLLDPLECIKKHITKLERENFGNKTTIEHQRETIGKLYGHSCSRYGKGSRR